MIAVISGVEICSTVIYVEDGGLAYVEQRAMAGRHPLQRQLGLLCTPSRASARYLAVVRPGCVIPVDWSILDYTVDLNVAIK